MYREELNLPEDSKWPSVFTMVIGIAYLGIGVIQIFSSLQLITPIIGFSDLIGGFLLIIVAAVFLTGVKPLSENNQEGYAFIAVGYILAALLFGLQILVILSNGLGWFLRFEDWITWDILGDFTPSLWMFIILMTGTGSLWVIGNMREKIMGVMKEGSQI
ncbi:MAG: hypothetical protein KGD60_05875 [Candidatus Thorarchaeota archaeon]|nr:hypothetical protein [Candidatus Thorarchaeota archaeon]